VEQIKSRQEVTSSLISLYSYYIQIHLRQQQMPGILFILFFSSLEEARLESLMEGEVWEIRCHLMGGEVILYRPGSV